MRRLRRGKRVARCEPSLDELLADPAARLLMRRDGVDEAVLRNLLAQLRARRAAPPEQPAA